jgi:hypothetical protein
VAGEPAEAQAEEVVAAQVIAVAVVEELATASCVTLKRVHSHKPYSEYILLLPKVKFIVRFNMGHYRCS